MALNPQHRFMVLTKRSARMREYVSAETPSYTPAPVRRIIEMASPDEPIFRSGNLAWLHAGLSGLDAPEKEIPAAVHTAHCAAWPLPNVWLGVSVEDQERAAERIPDLLATPATVRFISAEPLLSGLNLQPWLPATLPALDRAVSGPRVADLNWVIVGGESGPGARPCDIGWIRDIVRQCQAADVACFVKQLGQVWATEFNRRSKAKAAPYPGSTYAVSDLKGGTMELWPDDLRVREFPG